MNKRTISRKIELQRGSVLVMVFVLGAVFTAVGASILQLTVTQRSIATRNVANTNALLAAEAGIEQSLHELNQHSDFEGITTEQVFFDNEIQGRGTFVATVDEVEGSNAKTITAIGRVYRGNSSKPLSERKVRVIVVGTKSEGHPVHTGPGGLILDGSARITNADVHVNGTITLKGGGTGIGTDTQPLNVSVANIACPTGNNPGPTYPTLCTGTQPISIPDWSNASIIGTVCATGQTQSKFPDSPFNNNPPQIRQGAAGGSGLVPYCIAEPKPTPTYNRAAHKAGVTVVSPVNNNYVCQSWPYDRTWPDGLQLNGNVNVGGSCNVTINGNVYITGNLSIGGAAQIRVSESAGTKRPVIMVDGEITVGGSAQLIANSFGTGIYLISFKSNAPCSPECTELSGNELKSSQQTTTVDIGGGVNLPGMIFHAYWGKARLGGSGQVGSLIGQTVEIQGNGSITFGTQLSSGTETWRITGYQRIYND